MEQVMELVTTYLQQNGYAALAVASAMESANIPLPSELLFAFAGYLVYLGHMEFSMTIVIAVVSELIGASLSYTAGRYGGRAFVLRYGRYVLLSPRKLEITEKWFARFGLPAVFFARMLPIVRTFISLPAGFAKVNFIKFAVLTAAGSAVWILFLVYLGCTLGDNWKIVSSVGHNAGLAMAGLLVLIAVYFIWENMCKSNRETDK